MSVIIKTKIKHAALKIICICYAATAYADERIEFNTDVLDAADRSHIDLSRFSTDNYLPPGYYLLDIRINGQPVGQDTVRYIETSVGKSSQPCISGELVDKLALKEEVAMKVAQLQKNCYSLHSLPGAKLSHYAGVLEINVPQAWMKYHDANWTPPERWDKGVAGLLFDYSLNGQITRQFDASRNYSSLSAYGQAGANIGAWRLRGEYQTSDYGNSHQFGFDWKQIYAYRPLPMMAAKFTLGEIYLHSQVLDTLRFTGVNLASDERMLPPALQGYAPEVHGIARSHAKVTVSQNGRVIYQTSVPAGPFNIQDLRSSVRGTLDVRVEEQDGSASSFQVNTANIPYLTRPGYLRYRFSAGIPSLCHHKLQGAPFISGDFSWGISNAWSLYGGGLTAGKGYSAASIGVGRDLSVLGAISVDATGSWSGQPDGTRLKGRSYKLSYAKTFDEYNGSITFAGYRFAQEDFRSMAQYLDQRYQNTRHLGREKEMYTLTANKTFWADKAGKATTVFLTYTHQNYWGKRRRDRYGMSVGRTFRIGSINGISASLSAYRADDQGRSDDAISFSLSLPMGDSQWAGVDIPSGNGKTSPMASYTDNSDDNNRWRIRAGASQNRNARVDGYYQRRSPLAEINTNASYQQNRYMALGTTLRGGFTTTRHGAAMHNSSATMSTARMMVDTNGIGGVPLNGKRSRTNRFGIAVVPDVVSYNSFDTRVDVDALDGDIAPSKAISTTTLTEGAIGYQIFGMATGMKMMAALRLADNSVPPFGAEVYNADGVSVAMVLEEGKAWLAGVNPDETLHVTWGGKPQCQVTIPPGFIEQRADILLPCR